MCVNVLFVVCCNQYVYHGHVVLVVGMSCVFTLYVIAFFA